MIHAYREPISSFTLSITIEISFSKELLSNLAILEINTLPSRPLIRSMVTPLSTAAVASGSKRNWLSCVNYLENGMMTIPK